MKVSGGSALIVAPHHDDETFACGGTIALKRKAGVNVDIVFVTDGSQSHADLRPIDQIVASRKQEAIDAARLLGVPSGNLHFLDGPDGRMHEITEAARFELAGRLADIIEKCRAQEIYVPHRHDRHADHEVTYELTLAALERAGVNADLLEYPVWLLWKRSLKPGGLAEVRGAGRVDVSAAQALKNQAIAVYRSQLPSMPPGFLPQFAKGIEFFWRRPVRFAAKASSAQLAPALAAQ
jgi:LmbE family N-acetylglucosaminyl deacetylase